MVVGQTARIVVGVDGSPSSVAALEWAARQAELTGSRVEALTTWQWSVGFAYTVPVVPGYDPEKVAANVLEDALSRARAKHPKVELGGSVVSGYAAQVLVDASKGAELLVLGSRGHGELAGLLIGSVSEHCVAHANCPVVVVRS